MNRTYTHIAAPLVSKYPPVARNDAIEWEEMPSLVGRISPMGSKTEPTPPASPTTRARVALSPEVAEFNSAWGITMPAYLDETPQPTPFRETIDGLATREVTEPEVFQHFFG